MSDHHTDVPDFGYDHRKIQACIEVIGHRAVTALLGRWSHCALWASRTAGSTSPSYAVYGVPDGVRLLPDETLDSALQTIAVDSFKDPPDRWTLCIRLLWIERYNACSALGPRPRAGTRNDVYWGIWHLEASAASRVKRGLGSGESDFVLAASILAEVNEPLALPPDRAAALSRALRAAVPAHIPAGVGVLAFADPTAPIFLWFGACREDLRKVDLSGDAHHAAVQCATLASAGDRMRNVYVLVLGSGDELKWRVTYDGEAALRLLHATERARVRAVERERVRIREEIRKRRGRR